MLFTDRARAVGDCSRALKMLRWAFSVCALALMSTSVLAQSGPVGQWKLDDGTGTTVSDSSGGSHPGTFVNSPTWTTGRVNGGLNFASSNAAVSIPGTGSLTNLYTTGMSLSLWIKPASFSGTTARIVHKTWWWLGLDSNSTIKFTASQFASASAVRQSTSVIALNTWQHVVVTWDGSSTGGNIHIYVNGVAADGTATNGSGAAQSDASYNVYLGNRSDLTTPYAGAIDEVKIYDRILSSSEIQALADATAPSAPASPIATATSSTEVGLTWTASTDNVGVTGYRVERCAGASCTNFASVGTPTGTSFSDTGLTASTTYRYRIAAVDANTNLSSYSSIVSAMTLTGASGPIGYWKLDEGSGTSVADSAGTHTGSFTNSPAWITGQVNGALNFASSNAAVSIPGTGDLTNLYTTGMTLALWIKPASFGGSTGRIVHKTWWWLGLDSASTIKFTASQFATTSAVRQSTAVVALNTWQHVVVTWDGSSTGSNIHIYINGVAADGTATNGSGAAQSDSAYNLYFGNRPDLTTPYAGGIDEVRLYNRVLSSTEIAALVGGGGGDTTAPSTPTGLSASPASSSQINLSWTASTDNMGVTGYSVEQCQGASCSNFTQVGTPSGTTFSDTGLTASTTYRYRVRARDAVPNYSSYSTIVSASTQSGGGPDTTAPIAPGSPSASALSSSEAAISWTASTDNVAVTGYLIERCQGASCTTFTQVAAQGPVAAYSDSGLTGGAIYRYRIRARDAANNLSSYSPVVDVTTVSGTGVSGSTTYQYDSFGRLKQVTVTPQ